MCGWGVYTDNQRIGANKEGRRFTPVAVASAKTEMETGPREVGSEWPGIASKTLITKEQKLMHTIEKLNVNSAKKVKRQR